MDKEEAKRLNVGPVTRAGVNTLDKVAEGEAAVASGVKKGAGMARGALDALTIKNPEKLHDAARKGMEKVSEWLTPKKKVEDTP